MKKIMFGLALLLSIVASAGQVKWTALNVYGTDGATKNTSGIGYMFAASDMAAVTAALALTDASAAAAALDDLVVSKGTTTTGSFTGAAADYAAGTDNFFAVIFDAGSVADASNYYMTTTKSGSVPESGAATIAFGNQSSRTFGKTDAYAAAGWASGTPEPTSGMLLLLGGALLALRRKQK